MLSQAFSSSFLFPPAHRRAHIFEADFPLFISGQVSTAFQSELWYRVMEASSGKPGAHASGRDLACLQDCPWEDCCIISCSLQHVTTWYNITYTCGIYSLHVSNAIDFSAVTQPKKLIQHPKNSTGVSCEQPIFNQNLKMCLYRSKSVLMGCMF